MHRLDDKYFGSGQAHALLQLSAEFYERFIDYEYIFIYHLDALVFSDELLKWCDAGYDFIGAPWLPGPDCPWIEKDEEAYSGNSGFCLMNVRSFLRVLYSTRCRKSPGEILKELKPEAKLSERLKVYMKSLRQLSYFRNNINMHIKLWLDAGLAADLFWANHAKHYYPRFRVARTSEALPFAFETRPRDCFEMNGNKLPFGCHAWGQFDPEFWQPYLVTNKEPAAV